MTAKSCVRAQLTILERRLQPTPPLTASRGPDRSYIQCSLKILHSSIRKIHQRSRCAWEEVNLRHALTAVFQDNALIGRVRLYLMMRQLDEPVGLVLGRAEHGAGAWRACMCVARYPITAIHYFGDFYVFYRPAAAAPLTRRLTGARYAARLCCLHTARDLGFGYKKIGCCEVGCPLAMSLKHPNYLEKTGLLLRRRRA